MKEIEQFGVILALATLGYFWFTRPGTSSAIAAGGGGVPAFLTYNVPYLLGTDQPIPSLTAPAGGQVCTLCGIFGNNTSMRF